MKRDRARLSAIPTHEGDRVTTLELFFDLAFVFAFTQLSRLMAHEHSLTGVVQAVTILALLWWCWNSYGWLANLAHADRGWVRAVMLVAMASMVVVGVTVLEAYHDGPGGLFAPLVFVGAYLCARIVHAIAFAAVSPPELRRRAFWTTALAVVPSGALLTAGAMLGGGWQIALWLSSAAIEPIITQRMSVGVDWRVASTAHFTERHGLIVILAIGESIIAIGAGVASEPISLPILLGIGSAVVVAGGLWWAYFHRSAGQAERALLGLPDADRARTARDAYTYVSLLIVSGIVFTALGIEDALERVGSGDALGWFAAAALGVGIAGYLAATVLFVGRTTGRVDGVRLAGSVVVAAVTPLLAGVAPLVALAVAAGLMLLVFAAGGVRTRFPSGSAAGSLPSAAPVRR